MRLISSLPYFTAKSLGQPKSTARQVLALAQKFTERPLLQRAVEGCSERAVTHPNNRARCYIGSEVVIERVLKQNVSQGVRMSIGSFKLLLVGPLESRDTVFVAQHELFDDRVLVGRLNRRNLGVLFLEDKLLFGNVLWRF